MAAPFFYINDYASQKNIILNEDTSRHVIQVLRMKTGEQLNLTDGKGTLLTCVISEEHKKHCVVDIIEVKSEKPKVKKITIAISLLKNANRFEWFLEKATELGISEIIPLLCERTEKEKFRYDRMQGIIISAMLQSQQVWLPVLHEPMAFDNVVLQKDAQQKFIAYCENDEKNALTSLITDHLSLILIGPEGDFTKQEIELAIKNKFIPVSLGETRLRTETAGVAAAVIAKLG